MALSHGGATDEYLTSDKGVLTANNRRTFLTTGRKTWQYDLCAMALSTCYDTYSMNDDEIAFRAAISVMA